MIKHIISLKTYIKKNEMSYFIYHVKNRTFKQKYKEKNKYGKKVIILIIHS
jgi:hypothetical protein